ncbi:tricarballylate utilization 4Fe-4S protein TcuB [Neobacillus pocheonensis]|uniref:Tricarballylate utilization 4Fe-4S protein TcuB n=1 Tax=Neobacillus pocheonensis TaxID=363869 RepID=A0ABT0WEY7_9BACI|nr:tricarballylate utilization 4Fe-4S protein TcuB [Neobacillus pocheonensis]
MQSKELLNDGKRQMKLCNACRYCEGYCAVWQSIELRRDFTDNDMTYLANLCHDCRDCYYACPFTTPHEFGINPPKLFAQLREETYRKYASPRVFAKALGEKRSGFWITFFFGIILMVALIIGTNGTSGLLKTHLGTGAFYESLSEVVMIVVFLALGIWMVGGWIIGMSRFWQDIKSPKSEKVIGKDFVTGTKYALSLRYLGGEGSGCTYPTDEPSTTRRKLHHFVSYGFMLDLASTALGSFYAHVLHIPAPYPLYHPVVILGILGGLGIIIGVVGLLALKAKSDSEVHDKGAQQSGTSFAVVLLTVAVTGMILLLARDTAAMGILLAIHLGSVAALFFTAPYTKFAHFVYRYLALIRYAQEERIAAGAAQEVKTQKQPIKPGASVMSKH